MSKGNNLIIPNPSLDASKNKPIIDNMDLEQRAKTMHNKELEDLKLKIKEAKSKIDTVNKKIAESKENQKVLTENVKNLIKF